MRTLTEIGKAWKELLALTPADDYFGPKPSADEIAGGESLFRVARAEEADELNLDATAWRRSMEPREEGYFPLLVRFGRRHLDALTDIMSEPLPSEEYADVNLAHKLINAITLPLARWFVISGFVIGLAKAGQIARAKAALYALEFPSPLMRFDTTLAIYRVTRDASDLLAAQSSADRLSTNPSLRLKRYAKVRAYLAIYAETHAELDLFVARKTATEEGIDRGKGIDPEEATLANMDIYSVTHDPEDMAEVCKYLMMVVDLGRRAALVSVFDHLD